MKALAAFLKRKDIEISVKRCGTDVLVAMTQGLFCSLLIGTIVDTIGTQLHLAFLTLPVATAAGTGYTVGGPVSTMSDPAMATAIGWVPRCPLLVLFPLTIVGFISNALGDAGDPLAVPLVATLAAEAGKAVFKETRVDILAMPLIMTAVGLLSSALLAPALGRAAMKVGGPAMWTTELQPFLVGILVSLVAGIALTLPIDSAAICVTLDLTGFAGGAAFTGYCAQMVGFAMISYPENGFDSLVPRGTGTSMLQMSNIVRNPKVWITPRVTSMATGPIATCVFHLQQGGAAVTSGMSTCGLVGPLGVYIGRVKDVAVEQKTIITGTNWLDTLLVTVIPPAIFCPPIHALMCRVGLVKDGDLKLV